MSNGSHFSRLTVEEDSKVVRSKRTGVKKQAEACTLTVFGVLAFSGFSLLQCHSTALKSPYLRGFPRRAPAAGGALQGSSGQLCLG